MLIEFRVENHRSLRDEQALSMESTSIGDASDSRPRELAGVRTPVLPVAAVYGANASGKSNVLHALGFLRDAVLYSYRVWEPGGGVPLRPFAWGPSATASSLFEIEAAIGGVRYRYGFSASSLEIEEEWLYAWPKRRKQAWFERDGEHVSFGPALQDAARLLGDVDRPNALLLSIAAQHGHKAVTPLFAWFRAINAVNVGFEDSGLAAIVHRAGDTPWTQRRWLSPEGSRLEFLRSFLRNADLGIKDVHVDQEATDRYGNGLVQLRHEGAGDRWLGIEDESEGTRTLFVMAPAVFEALHDGAPLLVDELERSLHPSVGRKLVQLFNDPNTNPRNAQLIFTTHDTNLLAPFDGESALRRDQVWLTEKDSEGATTLYPLTDFKPRKGENLERGYLQGRYGAIPFLGPLLPPSEG